MILLGVTRVLVINGVIRRKIYKKNIHVEQLKVIQSAPYELRQVVIEPRIIEEVPVYFNCCGSMSM